jgi:hypothetical protein
MSHDESRAYAENPGVNLDVLFLVGGAALVVLGVGLMATHPAVRKIVNSSLPSVVPSMSGKLMPDLAGLGPDIQRYMKIREM